MFSSSRIVGDVRLNTLITVYTFSLRDFLVNDIYEVFTCCTNKPYQQAVQYDMTVRVRQKQDSTTPNGKEYLTLRSTYLIR